jgi:D-alanyl-D-alanine carboxypeptidase
MKANGRRDVLSVILRMLAPVMVILFTCSAIAALPEQRVTDPAMDLAGFVNGERLAQKLPGLAAVVVRSDGPPRVYVSGERRIGKGDLITATDRMHLGSLTKAITATLIGALVEKQLMTFETTIGQSFPELSAKIQPAYRNVSVRQLLSHAGGIPPYRTRESLQGLLTLKGTPSEQRDAFVERILTEPPRFEPGTRREYSNAGAAIAGAMAERIGGSPYRQLVQQLVFARLGGQAAFGNPGLAAEPQPWGHFRFLGVATEIAPANAVYTTPFAIEPAGDASPSMPDYGRFLQLHLRGLKGRDDVLKATTIQELHGKVGPNNPARGSPMGWGVMERDGVASHEHVGSYGAYVAYATIQPSRDIAVAAFTNLGGGQDLRDAVGRVALRIATRVAENAR